MGGIIWLASYPKSGNTWMRAFLHNLLQDPPAPVPINELMRFTLGDTMVDWYEKAAGGPVDQLTDQEFAALRPKVHALLTRASPDSVFVKTHMALDEVCGVPLINMDYTAGAIYILRDPRDIVFSAASHFGTDTDGMIALLNNPEARTGFEPTNVPQYYGTWSHHVRSWTTARHPQLHVVRYEDMLEKPYPTFAAVARFLGLNPERERIRKAIRFSSFRELQRQEKRDGFIERSVRAKSFFRAGTAGQWRSRLSPEQIARLAEVNGEVMREFGYR